MWARKAEASLTQSLKSNMTASPGWESRTVAGTSSTLSPSSAPSPSQSFTSASGTSWMAALNAGSCEPGMHRSAPESASTGVR